MYGVPLAFVAIIDYLVEWMVPKFSQTSHDYFFYKKSSYHLDIEASIESFYDTLLIICKNNNLAKAQILKSAGSYHLMNLLKANDLQTIIFLIKLAQDYNITNYMTGDLFDTICEVYNKIILRIVESMQDMGSPLENQVEHTTSNQQVSSLKAPKRRLASIFKKGRDKKAFIKSIAKMVSSGCVETPVVFAN